jgi:CRP-like cAMP-binding protein
MELYSLVVIWCTNWGGLMLYVDGNGNGDARIWLTTFIIGLVCSYNIAAIYIFGKTLIGAAIQNRKDRRSTLQGGDNNTVIVPSTTTSETDSEVEKVNEEQSSSNDNDNAYSTEERHHQIDHSNNIHDVAISQIVQNIHDEHRLSQAGLQQDMDKRQRQQRRKTQYRLDARKKLKKQKLLSKIPAFSMLDEEEIDAMINAMSHESHLIGSTLCIQGDIAMKFYVVMKGECCAYISDSTESDRKVGTISTFSFFGENALLGATPGISERRNATVKVESQSVSLLVLTKSKFYELIENGDLNPQVLDGMKEVDRERQVVNEGKNKVVLLGKEEGRDDEGEKEEEGEGDEGMSVTVLVKGGGDADYV